MKFSNKLIDHALVYGGRDEIEGMREMERMREISMVHEMGWLGWFIRKCQMLKMPSLKLHCKEDHRMAYWET